MISSALAGAICLLLVYGLYAGGREYAQKKVWHTWEERLAHRTVIALTCGGIALIGAVGAGQADEVGIYPDQVFSVEDQLKFFAAIFALFFVPMLIGSWRGQKIVGALEVKKGEGQ